MIQVGVEFSFMRNRIIAYAIDAIIETGINAFDAIIWIAGFNDSCPAGVTVAYKLEYCYKQQ